MVDDTGRRLRGWMWVVDGVSRREDVQHVHLVAKDRLNVVAAEDEAAEEPMVTS